MPPHWSVEDKPAGLAEPASMVNVDDPPHRAATDPSPLAPVERIVEIFEMLYLREPGFTGELLQQLGRCSPEDLAKLFGVPSRATSPAYGSQPADSAPEGRGEFSHVESAAELPAERFVMTGGNERIVADPPPPVWDEHGYRISRRLPSSFPRYNPVPKGSHWSR